MNAQDETAVREDEATPVEAEETASAETPDAEDASREAEAKGRLNERLTALLSGDEPAAEPEPAEEVGETEEPEVAKPEATLDSETRRLAVRMAGFTDAEVDDLVETLGPERAKAQLDKLVDRHRDLDREFGRAGNLNREDPKEQKQTNTEAEGGNAGDLRERIAQGIGLTPIASDEDITTSLAGELGEDAAKVFVEKVVGPLRKQQDTLISVIGAMWEQHAAAGQQSERQIVDGFFAGLDEKYRDRLGSERPTQEQQGLRDAIVSDAKALLAAARQRGDSLSDDEALTKALRFHTHDIDAESAKAATAKDLVEKSTARQKRLSVPPGGASRPTSAPKGEEAAKANLSKRLAEMGL